MNQTLCGWVGLVIALAPHCVADALSSWRNFELALTDATTRWLTVVGLVQGHGEGTGSSAPWSKAVDQSFDWTPGLTPRVVAV